MFVWRLWLLLLMQIFPVPVRAYCLFLVYGFAFFLIEICENMDLNVTFYFM